MKNLLFIIFIALSSSAMAQETGTIILARKGLWTGTAGPTKIFMDGTIICELSNNSFSKHVVPIGVHKFNAQWYSKKSKDKTEEMAVEIEVKAGQEYYLQTIKQDKGLTSYIHMQEITANTWKKTKEDLDEDDCH